MEALPIGDDTGTYTVIPVRNKTSALQTRLWCIKRSLKKYPYNERRLASKMMAIRAIKLTSGIVERPRIERPWTPGFRMWKLVRWRWMNGRLVDVKEGTVF